MTIATYRGLIAMDRSCRRDGAFSSPPSACRHDNDAQLAARNASGTPVVLGCRIQEKGYRMFRQSLERLAVPALGAALAVSAAALPGRAAAQSLDPKHPAPLLAGENTGTIDSMVGPQFWSFDSLKGSGVITVRFGSVGLFGNATSATIQVVMHDTAGKTFGSETITSNGKPVEVKWPGTFAKGGIVVL